MRSPLLWALTACLAAALPAAAADGDEPMISIAIHGGAGVISRASMTAENERAYRADLERALDAGYAVLEKGGASLDAVVAAVKILEDSPLFNAGKGAVFSHAGINELDAAIMDGATQKAGAVAGVRHVRNPIELARMVMERTPHVLLAGEGAEEFALEQGVELVPGSYFYTERRWKQLEEAQKAEQHRVAAQGRHRLLRDGRRGRARPGRQPRRRDVDRRHDQQALGPHRRLADHRRRHLRGQRDLRGVGDRQRRVLHPRRRRPRDLRARAPVRRQRGGGGARR